MTTTGRLARAIRPNTTTGAGLSVSPMAFGVRRRWTV